jgi:hypothetical protein
MANSEHLEILKQGVKVWNAWRENNRNIDPDLSGAHLVGMNLVHVNLVNANLRNANLHIAHLDHADLINADLRDAYLGHVSLLNTNFTDSKLTNTNLNGTSIGATTFGNVDLSQAKGLDSVWHVVPSSVGIDTIYRSKGNIPEIFLRGCGVPDSLIVQIPALVAAMEPIQLYSCFISYSHKDEEFARNLYSRMRDAKLRVWYAPEEMKGGQKIHEQIFSAIQIHDKLLLVLSEHSLQSEWVVTEIRRARKAECDESRRKLFPIRLVDFDAIQQWECFDADSGKDLAVELREYFIPDFSNWKDHDSFEKAFDRLLRDLKAEVRK